MKLGFTIAGAVLVSFMAGCSSTPLAVAPVGPNPNGLNDHAKYGQLQVFSVLIGRTEGDNPTWHQHADYTILDQQGRSVMHVANETGYYARSPRLVNLPPGKYIVKAEAKDYLSVRVPVVIEPGRTTKVHLDDNWMPVNASKTEVVSLPSGTAVGWSPDDH